jgi:hypothetical protein
MMRWLGPARRVMAMTKIAAARRRDEPQPAATARAGEDIEIEHGAAGVLSSRGESHPSP